MAKFTFQNIFLFFYIQQMTSKSKISSKETSFAKLSAELIIDYYLATVKHNQLRNNQQNIFFKHEEIHKTKTFGQSQV